jgi:hypothetical protein
MATTARKTTARKPRGTSTAKAKEILAAEATVTEAPAEAITDEGAAEAVAVDDATEMDVFAKAALAQAKTWPAERETELRVLVDHIRVLGESKLASGKAIEAPWQWVVELSDGDLIAIIDKARTKRGAEIKAWRHATLVHGAFQDAGGEEAQRELAAGHADMLADAARETA